MFYKLIRQLLFKVPAEMAHGMGLAGLQTVQRFGLARLFDAGFPAKPCRLLGLDFPNPVGLAAGLDKNGAYLDALAALGFGFIEIGTVTPRPQPGNPKPRLFRLPPAQAIINRMGFNNRGVEAALRNIRRSRYRGVLGINIGKNFDTPLERAVDDYVFCLRRVHAVASYIAVNISSPNTPDLRELQQVAQLGPLLADLKTEQQALEKTTGRRRPLLVKIAPDLDDERIAAIAELVQQYEIDGVIATNTTVRRVGVETLPHGDEPGGLSGAPVRSLSTAVVRKLHHLLGNRVPIIGVGGIVSGEDAREKLAAGASLVQVYTGLIYRGPALIREILQTI